MTHIATYKEIILLHRQTISSGAATVKETPKGPVLVNLRRQYGPLRDDGYCWPKRVVPDRSCRDQCIPGHDVLVLGVTHDTGPETGKGVLFVRVRHDEHLCRECVAQTMRDWLSQKPRLTCPDCGYDSSGRSVIVPAEKSELAQYGAENLPVFLDSLAFRFIVERRGQAAFREEVEKILKQDHEDYHQHEMHRRQRELELREAVARWADAYWPGEEITAEGAVECWNGCGVTTLDIVVRPDRTVQVSYYNPFAAGFAGQALGANAGSSFVLGLDDFEPDSEGLRNRNRDIGTIVIGPHNRVSCVPMCCPAL